MHVGSASHCCHLSLDIEEIACPTASRSSSIDCIVIRNTSAAIDLLSCDITIIIIQYRVIMLVLLFLGILYAFYRRRKWRDNGIGDIEIPQC